MTSASFPYFGFNVTAEDEDASGSIGVRVNGVPMLNSVYGTGQRLAAAGAEGIPVELVIRSDVQILKSAYHVIETDPLGQRYYLRSELRRPDKYLIKAKEKPVERNGQFGASLKEKRYI